MFDAAGITKLRATDAHRKKYEQWSEEWGMSHELGMVEYGQISVAVLGSF